MDGKHPHPVGGEEGTRERPSGEELGFPTDKNCSFSHLGLSVKVKIKAVIILKTLNAWMYQEAGTFSQLFFFPFHIHYMKNQVEIPMFWLVKILGFKS